MQRCKDKLEIMKKSPCGYPDPDLIYVSCILDNNHYHVLTYKKVLLNSIRISYSKSSSSCRKNLQKFVKMLFILLLSGVSAQLGGHQAENSEKSG